MSHKIVHDKFFKLTLSKLTRASYFLKHALPKEVLRLIDLDSLQLERAERIDGQLKSGSADLIYSVNYKHKKGKLFIVTEHKSYYAPRFFIQILRYVLSVLDESYDLNKNQVFSLAMPVLFYHGPKPFSKSMNFFDHFKAPKQLIKDFFIGVFPIVDLNNITDKDLRSYGGYGFAALLMKHYRDKDFSKVIERHADWFNEISNNIEEEDLMEGALTYIFEATCIERSQLWRIIRNKQLLDKSLGGKIMTLAEQYELEAQQRERKGIKTGIKTGEERRSIKIAKKLLRFGVNPRTVARISGQPFSKILKFVKK